MLGAVQLLSWLLFLGAVALYMHFSAARHRDNPEDRIAPSAHQLAQGIRASVLQPAEEDEALPDGATR